jgi:1-acyl-sn-glycerol-3-phosphate acyltransferase
LRLIYRLPWLLLHLFIGLPLTLLSFVPPARAVRIRGRALNEIMQCWFAAMTCRIFGLRRRVSGTFAPGAQLIAANHISWLDIQLLHSISPMSFVAKAEIQRWPLAGWVASFGDTVFHQRGSHDSSSSVTDLMNQKLRLGGKVAIFAEGGILPGHGVKRFHGRLFAAALDSDIPVQPVMIRYLRGGAFCHAVTFLENESFVRNFFRLLRQPPCEAEVAILPVIRPQGRLRRNLASEAQAAVEAAFSSVPPR